jgi:predicted Zn finger-like uncharacterized protein
VKISCPTCSAKYSIADEKVVSRLAKIRCRKCGSTIVIDGKVNPPSVTATSGGDAGEAHEAAEAAGAEFSVDFGEGDQRTMPLADIVSAYNAGQITGETYVWADGFPDWKPLSDVEEIVEALHAAASGAATGSKPQASSSPWDAKPAPSPAPERAAARPARGATSDLFGRIERAGSEDEVATSAPDASGGGGSGTGARNESSVLFSLSALTSASKPSQTGSRSSASGLNLGGATTASREDSGLIDLKALTAAAVKTEAAAAAVGGGFAAPAMAPLAASPLGVAAPLGLGSPIGAGLGADMAPAKSKTGLFIAIGIVVAAVIVALALILRPTPPPVVVAPPAPPPPAPAPTPTPTPTLAAAPPPTGAPSAEEPYKKMPTTGVVHRSCGAIKSSCGSGETKTSAPAGGDTPPPPPKKSNNCGCSPSDLNCNMRCRAKG